MLAPHKHGGIPSDQAQESILAQTGLAQTPEEPLLRKEWIVCTPENLAGRPEQAAMQRRLRDRLAVFFDQYADPKYDLSRDGGSKTHLLTRPKK